MNSGNTGTTSFSKAKACSFGGVLMLLGASTALAQDEIVIGGKAVPVEEASYKCDITAEEIPDDLSIKRLANCESAELIDFEMPGKDLRAVKFTISPDDKPISSGIRAELRDMYVAENGEEVWYRISTLIPKTFPMEADHRLVLSQWHERLRAGGHSLRPNISHRLWNGRFVVTLWSDDVIERLGTIEGDGQILYSEPRIDQGVYHEYVYRVVWSPEDDGRIDAWMRQCPALRETCDGRWQDMIQFEGTTGYSNDKVDGYYFKYGLYTVSDFEVPFTAFHKDYWSGPTAESIGLSDPIFK
jgi:hypothetical protein